MCGRGRCTLRPDAIAQACHFNSRPIRHVDIDRYRPSYNVAPGFNVPVVRLGDGDGDGFVSHCMKWGLVPKETDEIDHFKMVCAFERDLINAVTSNFDLLHLCISMRGVNRYERSHPFVDFFQRTGVWYRLKGETLYTFTIITTSSSSSLEWLHGLFLPPLQ
ncbi:abasic site processing protein HMCES-like [Salvia hispanica]|uniref:abasic site processing protein HMCES-like n=1 Tax=Salvia hispanica TaxID=49212 RepID=UPI0020098C35|nr:abasic site processing protein HMCES-like [Salvia hispanica]